MKDNLTQMLARYRRAFGEFSNGQKAVAIVGSGALLLAAFLVFRWVSAPTYAPLYSNLASSDASSVIDELNKEGVKYKLAGDGTTIEVPQNAVYSTRIALSGKNLPAGNSSPDGYNLLDNQSLSTSDFQEQTDYKRAMEGELDKTLEAMTGVQTAVVHLAIPEKQVFSDKQDPTTASVLLQLDAGTQLTSDQVQAVVHLVASSIDGLDPKNVTVADQKGDVLTTDDSTDGLASAQADKTEAYEDDVQSEVQKTLDKIVGAGNATATVTANLNFDQTTTDNLTYGKATTVPSLSSTKSTEKYNGPASGASSVGGVVGPDGQMDSTTTTSGSNGASTYDKESETSDNAVDQTRQHIVTAPGQVENLHIGVVMDSGAVGTVQPAQVKQLIASAIGINAKRGDTIDVATMPFNQTAAQTAAKELAAAQAASKHASQMRMLRDLGIGAVIALVLLLAWLKGRRRAKAREQATSYVVEQLRADAEARAALEVPNPALAALEATESEEDIEAANLRQEVNSLVEKQPEDVANLLRGWLVERPR